MSETEVTKTSTDIPMKEKNGPIRMFNPANSTFFVQLSHKVQNCVKAQIARLAKDGHGVVSTIPFIKGDDRLSTSWNVDLDKQLQTWRENPTWTDEPPEIKVTVPKGTLSSLSVKVNVGLPPDAVYNIVTDPDNKRVFKNIKEVMSRKVLVDEGARQLVELEQAALWRFLWWSGTISVHVLVDQNRTDHSMKFKQLKTGFMKKFEGCWMVEPLFVDEGTCFPFKPKNYSDYYKCTKGKGRIGSKVSLEQLIQPAIVPPPPISWYLRGITTRTTEMLINDLLAEAARIRSGFDNEKYIQELKNTQGTSDEELINDIRDIKERWAMRRRNAKQSHMRRLVTAK